MDSRTCFLRLSTALTFIFLSFVTHFNLCDARDEAQMLHGSRLGRNPMRRSLKQFTVPAHLDKSNSNSYGTRFHFSLPPFDSLATSSLPENSCPYCAYPPSTPQPQPQPPGYSSARSPVYPPAAYMASPPYQLEPTPTKQIPTPPKNVPIPPRNKPPMVLQPPPSATPPQHLPQFAVWCVAKASVPDLVIQAAMDYACGTAADCKPIQPNGVCFVPNTLIAHASYAFNSYWQNTKLGGGTCDFGGIAMLVTVDPSFNGCHYMFK